MARIWYDKPAAIVEWEPILNSARWMEPWVNIVELAEAEDFMHPVPTVVGVGPIDSS